MNMPILSHATNQDHITMSSPEMVDFINAHRKAVATSEKPYVELQHRSFMAKVPAVLGEDNAAKFFASQNYGNGNTRAIYNFPKREACLMVMSYSYELQAQVFDRMTAMEDALKTTIDLNNPLQLRSLLLNYAEQNIHLTTENKTLSRAIDNITATESGVKFQQACKILNVKQADLAKWLRDHNWDRYINKSRASTHYSQERGYCETKFSEVVGVKPCGQPFNYTKIEFFILPKGMAALAKKFSEVAA